MLEYLYDIPTPKQIKESNIVAFAISSNEVKNIDFRRLDMLIKNFEKCKKKGKQKLMLTFSGYEYISDEIYEIKEIRNYVKKMFNKYPHIFYFLTPFYFNNKIILCCISNVEMFYSGQRKDLSTIFINKEERIPIKLKIDVPLDVRMKIANKTLEYGLKIKENKKEILKLIDNVLYMTEETMKNNYIPTPNEFVDVLEECEKIAQAYWNYQIKIQSKIDLVKPENIQEFVDKNSLLIHEYIETNTLSGIINNNSNIFTNVFFINDFSQGIICEKCGINYTIILKSKVDFIDDINSVIFLPSTESYIVNKIFPASEKYNMQPQIPINYKEDFWYCPKCKKLHKFKYDKEIGLVFDQKAVNI